MLNDATGFKKIYLAAGLSSVYFYPQLFIFLHNYRVNTFKAEDNYWGLQSLVGFPEVF